MSSESLKPATRWFAADGMHYIGNDHVERVVPYPPAGKSEVTAGWSEWWQLYMAGETDQEWEEWKAARDKPELVPCPACGRDMVYTGETELHDGWYDLWDCPHHGTTNLRRTTKKEEAKTT